MVSLTILTSICGLLYALDTDGFVIPSLEIGDIDGSKTDASEVEASKPPSPKAKKDEKIYLGPHGAPPSQSKQQELNSTGRKQRFKQKLKEADQRSSGTGRENKLESLKELVGGGKGTVNTMKGSSREWLDPHCHESQFEKWNPQAKLMWKLMRAFGIYGSVVPSLKNQASINEIVDPKILIEEGGACIEQQLQAVLNLGSTCIEEDPQSLPIMVCHQRTQVD
uniref:Uncharacterized protein n=1 Tax=Fagus sylvatica TaxID=28930 RepID=A0A2N9ITC9_FAGSY